METCRRYPATKADPFNSSIDSVALAFRYRRVVVTLNVRIPSPGSRGKAPRPPPVEESEFPQAGGAERTLAKRLDLKIRSRAAWIARIGSVRYLRDRPLKDIPLVGLDHPNLLAVERDEQVKVGATG